MRPIKTLHCIFISSINKFGEVEWREDVTAGKRQTVVKKARLILANCGADEKTEVFKSQITRYPPDNGTAQDWKIGVKPSITKKDDSTPRQQTRRAKLNEAASRAGFGSWSKLETAVIKGELIIK